jgi:signal transduction histidine kinase
MRIFSKHLHGIKKTIAGQQRRNMSFAAPLSRMRKLHQLGRRFLADSNVDSIVRGVFEAASEVPGVDVITFRLRNETTGDFEPIACHNLDPSTWRAAAPVGRLGLSRQVVEKEQAVILFDLERYASTKSATFLRRYHLSAYVGVPLLAADKVISVIGFYSQRGRRIDDLDIDFLTLLADFTTLALRYAPWRSGADNRSASSDSSERAKAEFLNVMSHEFRTPLSLIMGHAGMIREGLLGEINDEQRTSLDRVMENSKSLLGMVLSMLHASMIESGGIHVVARDIVLHQLFDELRAAYRAQDNEQRKIVWYCSPDQELLRSDPERLKEILRHLIDNALKFTARGRVVVSAEKVDRPSTVRITVADTGVGIPAEALPFIFEKFQQSDSSGTRMFSGAGLGLYIAKKYAQLLGGDLSVTSEVGKGSTFTLTLPYGA